MTRWLGLLLIALLSSSLSAQAPCYIRMPTGCAKATWMPLDTKIKSNPVRIFRDFYSGALKVQVCESLMPTTNTDCIPVERACLPCTYHPTTLAGWCADLKALPVPAPNKPGQPADLYADFRIGGVCP